MIKNPNQLEIKIDSKLANQIYRSFKHIIANTVGMASAVIKVDLEKGAAELKELVHQDTRFDSIEKKVAFELITEALKKAIQKLREAVFKEYSIQPTHLAENKTYQTLIQKQESVFKAGFVIDASFFKQPKQFALLPPLQQLLQELFKSIGLKDKNALHLSLELKEYFVIELHRYWREHTLQLQALDAYFKSPFSATVDNILEWQEYNIHVRRTANSTVFDDEVTLNDLYISLRGYYVVKEEAEDYLDKDTFIQQVIRVEDSLNQWLVEDDKVDHIRVVSGGPGRGKSTLCKIWAAKLTEQVKDWQVLYLPFHLLSLKDSLENMVEEYIKLPHLPFTQSPLVRLKGSESKLLLIFDGLDELSAQNLQTADIVKQFIDELRHKLNHYNYEQLHLKVLLTGRDLVIQQCQKIFKTSPQFIHLLPYFIPSKDRQNTPYFANYPIQDPENLLEADQRNLWWANYASQKKEHFNGMPKELIDLSHLDDITTEPLLNYLVAITWRRSPEIFNKGTNLNTIYEQLIGDVYERDYAPTSAHHSSKEIGSKKDFLAILEMIGLAAWQGGNTRATTAQAIDNFIKKIGSNKLKKKFKAYKDINNTHTDRLFLAFYFKEAANHPTTGVPSFEFTHKSFGEYLTARGIINLFKKCNRRFIKFQEEDDEDSLPFESKEVLLELLQISQYPIDKDIITFVKNELTLLCEKNRPVLIKFHDNLCTWINYASTAIETIDPLIYPKQHLSWNSKLQIYRNLEELLMVIRGTAAATLDKKSPLNFNVQNWYKRITFHDSFPIGVKNLNHISLVKENLLGAVLLGAVLARAVLAGANLFGADLSGADLFGANLERANLERANLVRANLFGADLSGADLSGADLFGADLFGANLHGANLYGANLYGAVLAEAVLASTYLSRAVLLGAILIETDLSEANLSGAVLLGADLTGAILSKVDLSEAKFEMHQLLQVKTLYQCKGLSKEQQEALLKQRPDIFDKPKED